MKQIILNLFVCLFMSISGLAFGAVSGGGSFDGNLTGDLSVSGNAGISGTMDVQGTLTASSIEVGPGTASTVDGVNDLYVTDDVEVGGALYANKISATTDGSSPSSIEFSNGEKFETYVGVDKIIYATSNNGVGEAILDVDGEVRGDTAYFSGNVGIGTGSPSKVLDVIGDSKIEGNLEIGRNSYAKAIVGYNNSPYPVYKFDSGNSDVNSFIYGAQFTRSGNVGIGTTSPTALLDVNGDASIRDSILLPSTTTTLTGVIYKNGSRWLWDFDAPDNGVANSIGNNIFLGNSAGSTSTGVAAANYWEGSNNVGVGAHSLDALTTGYYNVAVGSNSLTNCTTGAQNFALGHNSLTDLVSGQDNIGIGIYSLYMTNGAYSNIAIGQSSGFRNVTGYSNLFIGQNSGNYISGGTIANTTGDYNIFLGQNTKAFADNDQNEIVIGYNTTGHGSNTVTIGNSSVTDNYLTGDLYVDGNIYAQDSLYVGDQLNTIVDGVGDLYVADDVEVDGNLYVVSGNVGIGTTRPTAKLDVDGSVYFGGNIGIGGDSICTIRTDTDATCDSGTKIGEDNSKALCLICS